MENSRYTVRIRRQNRSLAEEEGRDAVVLKHELRQLLSLRPGVPLQGRRPGYSLKSD